MIESVCLMNLNTQDTIVIDKSDSDFVLDTPDFGTVKGTHNSYRYVNQIGVCIDSTTLNDRSISISGWVIGDTYDILEINKAKLNHVVNPLQTIRAIVLDSYRIDFKPDYSVKYSTSYAQNNEVLCKFLIQGTCADPLFTMVSSQGALIASTIPKFKFPLIIPTDGILLGLREPALLMDIKNPGDIETGMIITLACSTAAVKNPILYNLTSGYAIRVLKSMEPGETIIISTVMGKKFIHGIIDSTELNYLKYFDFSTSWLQLIPGINTIKYDAAENPQNLEVSIRYQPKFLEVQ